MAKIQSGRQRFQLGQLFAAFFVATLPGIGLPVGTAQAREVVAIDPSLPPGLILVRNGERRLYLVTAPGQALRYPVAVGKGGHQWTGTARVDGKYQAPAWSPPAIVRRDKPGLPDVIPGGAPGNPMGAAALTLDRGEYAIHGTSRSMRASIGRAASYGCIRMLDEHVLDLFSRVKVGATVLAVP
jgi:lipoprotein-anchoring transpeptidase ErfK/SrfK